MRGEDSYGPTSRLKPASKMIGGKRNMKKKSVCKKLLPELKYRKHLHLSAHHTHAPTQHETCEKDHTLNLKSTEY